MTFARLPWRARGAPVAVNAVLVAAAGALVIWPYASRRQTSRSCAILRQGGNGREVGQLGGKGRAWRASRS